MKTTLYRGKPTEYFEHWRVFRPELFDGTFIIGSLNVCDDRYYISNHAMCTINSCVNNGTTTMLEVKPDTVGEFIGRCDKNDTKIFEGDVVKTKYGRLCEVIWFESNQFIGWDLKPVNNFDDINHNAPDIYDMWCSENLEVVGNIYDNLEFAKGA